MNPSLIKNVREDHNQCSPAEEREPESTQTERKCLAKIPCTLQDSGKAKLLLFTRDVENPGAPEGLSCK